MRADSAFAPRGPVARFVLVLVVLVLGTLYGGTGASAAPCSATGTAACDQAPARPSLARPDAAGQALGTVGSLSGPQKRYRNRLTWVMRNGASYIIALRFFSMSRDAVWPAGDRVFILDDRLFRKATLRCRPGEKICYGAWYHGDPEGTYWGVGPDGDQGCAACCATCNGGRVRPITLID